MKEIVSKAFEMLSVGFDKIPLLNKIKGYRTLVGFIMCIVFDKLLDYKIGNPEIIGYVFDASAAFTIAALNAKGRSLEGNGGSD